MRSFLVTSSAPVFFGVIAVILRLVLVHFLVGDLNSTADVIIARGIARSDCEAHVGSVLHKSAELRYLSRQLLLCDIGAEYNKFITARTVYLVIVKRDLQKSRRSHQQLVACVMCGFL